jgi:methylated-DNA-[protein]-cysteine S-methyltransferase
MIHAPSRLALAVFQTDLAWTAMIGEDSASDAGPVVEQLTIGHDSAAVAVRALDAELLSSTGNRVWKSPLIKRLQAFARGECEDDFGDVILRLDELTAFQRRVVQQCRRIPPGETRTYGELALASGAPRAARAVGSVMASNRVPIIVPCHRVLRAGGKLGGYSMGSGLPMKLRLLKMEGAQLPASAGLQQGRKLMATVS